MLNEGTKSIGITYVLKFENSPRPLSSFYNHFLSSTLCKHVVTTI